MSGYNLINPEALRLGAMMPVSSITTLARIGFFAGVRDGYSNDFGEPERAKLEAICTLARLPAVTRSDVLARYEVGYAYSHQGGVTDIDEFIAKDPPEPALDAAQALALIQTLLPHINHAGGLAVIMALTEDGTYHG